ncbi:GNAT family N-acetyltransferase [Parenemella sanctibonifatiensis]|uniref:GNAT family N-acetyltransferase n=1 Tax=Parenemella sanctibonifatiensis TaxID=2016505 RepID=A0A255EB93_9ACTN|nr:GNAT family protein [Parenemella sanctibonifatiensis]OYN86765.1 GNAT family N-acetyltransferase [Parenemella sanctibonifatiensis]
MEHDLTLRHESITLRPLQVADAAALRALVDEEMWAGMSVPFPRSNAHMERHLAALIARPQAYFFAVERGGELIGRTSYYDLVEGLRVEIGNTIYGRPWWGTEVNPTTKLLLFSHAFSGFGVVRVALRCDARNRRSHNSIRRLGARYEGTLRNFRHAADGTVADMDYFSVVDREWPAVRERLEMRLDHL